jgi:separase
VDLRSVFEELSTDRQSREDDHHIFLAVDKNLQSIPWESIPILRGRPVSRIPSMSFLLDRIELCRHPLPGRPQPSNDRTFVDPRKTFFVMNPEGDLRHTETELGPWLNEMKSAGWNGISNRAPSQEELIKGLTTNDLVL